MLLKVVEMSQSHTSCGSEEHPLHAFLLLLKNGSRDELKHLSVWGISSFNIILDNIGWNGAMKLRDHLLDERDNILIVLKL